MPTDEQRAAYLAAAAKVEETERRIKPQADVFKRQIAMLEAPEVKPAREALTAITEDIGEPVTKCIFCDTLLWDDDDYVAGDEDMCVPCKKDALDSMSEEDKAARLAEIEAEEG